MTFEPWYKSPHELNLQGLAQHFAYGGAGGHGSQFDHAFIHNAKSIAFEYSKWRSFQTVNEELEALYADENFISAFIEKGEIEVEQALCDLAGFKTSRADLIDHIDSDYDANKQEILEQLRIEPPIVHNEMFSIDYMVVPIKNECIHLFESIPIPKESTSYAYFFALRITRLHSESKFGFLEYQFQKTFESNFVEYTKVLISLIASYHSMIDEPTKELIRDWIRLKAFINDTQPKLSSPKIKGLYPKEGYNLPQIFGKEWNKFKKDFPTLVKNKKQVPSKTFAQVVFCFWVERKDFGKEYNEALSLAIGFHREFKDVLKVGHGTLRECISFNQRLEEHETIPADIKRFCSEYLLG